MHVRTSRRIVLGLVVNLALATLLLSNQREAASYNVCSGGACIHEYMGIIANIVYPGREITTYSGDIQRGIGHEDEFDHVYGLNAKDPISGDPILATSTHFWDADAGPNAPTQNAEPFGEFPNSWQKVNELWVLALGAYGKGDKHLAYHYLGHVLHHFGDNTVPAHVHDDPHGPEILNDDSFHVWMDKPGDPPPNAGLTPDEIDRLRQAGPIPIPPGVDKLHWLLYTTNQIADYFASDDVDGDSDDPLALMSAEFAALPNRVRTTEELEDNDECDTVLPFCGSANNNDGDLSIIREHSYLRGIRVQAAVLQLFEETVRQPTLIVVIEHVEEDEDHDYACALVCVKLSDPDYYAQVMIGGRRGQNRGDKVDNDNVIDPGWAFGNTVGTTGTVQVRVDIVDHDGARDDTPFAVNEDDPSDIDQTGDDADRALEFDIDIGKCLRGEGGAIVGDDVNAACDTLIVQTGDNDDEASQVRLRIFMANRPPTADAGGPYTTPEGTDVQVDGSASSDPENDIVSRSWDLDGDGDCDDATGATATFSAVGRDGTTTIKHCVTDGAGSVDTDTTTVTVTNVAPAVVFSTPLATAENTSLTIAGTISDAGWLDPLSGTIDWGDGSPAAPLAGTIENGRPTATLTFSASHTYGDNGTFLITVCGSDDDTRTCTATTATVDNTAPAVTIDLSGAISVNGTPTIIAHAGQSVSFSGRGTDPGSDDLTFTWTWGDGTVPSSQVSLVNPPNPDPLPSPSVQPRDVVDAQAHAFGKACAFEITLSVQDDDGGQAAQAASVIIVGNSTTTRLAGYWKQQFRYFNTGKGPAADFDQQTLDCYLRIATYMSRVFNEQNNAATSMRAEDILDTSQTSDILELFDQQLLATWLNFANGGLRWNQLVDTDGDRRPDTLFLDAVGAAESLRLNPSATRAQLDRQKVIMEGWMRQR